MHQVCIEYSPKGGKYKYAFTGPGYLFPVTLTLQITLAYLRHKGRRIKLEEVLDVPPPARPPTGKPKPGLPPSRPASPMPMPIATMPIPTAATGAVPRTGRGGRGGRGGRAPSPVLLPAIGRGATAPQGIGRGTTRGKREDVRDIFNVSKIITRSGDVEIEQRRDAASAAFHAAINRPLTQQRAGSFHGFAAWAHGKRDNGKVYQNHPDDHWD